LSNLPIFSHLDVNGYAMYPGSPDMPGIRREIQPGMTLIVGANGLGKTTLVTLLRHMCAGPERLQNRSGSLFEAGRLKTTGARAQTFGDRVADRASQATATLQMGVGPHYFRVGRSLQDLSLLELVVDGEELEPLEANFTARIVEAAEVTDYADWILIIDHLIFVTEDRLQPFWDRNVQRQLLRVLINDPSTARLLADAESRHISADSDFRNARVQLNRHKKRYERIAQSLVASGSVQEQLLELESKREEVNEEVTELEAAHEELSDQRNDALRSTESAEVALQIAMDALEVERFRRIEAAMPGQDDVIRYLTARASSATDCPACAQATSAMAERVAAHQCFLCGSALTAVPGGSDESDVLVQLESEVRTAQRAIDAGRHLVRERTDAVIAAEISLTAARSRRADLASRIRALRAELPRGSEDLTSTSTLIADLEEDLLDLRTELAASRDTLTALIADNNRAIGERQSDIKEVFDAVATRFLVERCHLVPHQTLLRIGQEGERFEVQAFDLALSSASDVGEPQRDSRDEVSESQRVYVDVAFRIALILSCASGGNGSLVIDAPEGSLDAVFVENAARLLVALVEPAGSESRLILATNLVEGSLLPALAREGGIENADDPRVIDLLEIAAPTAALRDRGDEYRRIRDQAFAQRRDGSDS
jgi:predicted  nucleic acid-binding Zn-ribbon protein